MCAQVSHINAFLLQASTVQASVAIKGLHTAMLRRFLSGGTSLNNDSSNSVADLCLEVAQTVLPEFPLAVRIMVVKKTTQHKGDRNVTERT